MKDIVFCDSSSLMQIEDQELLLTKTFLDSHEFEATATNEILINTWDCCVS